MTKNRDIAVIGAGLMGHGIALTFARAGYHVRITDPTAEALASVEDRAADSLRLMGVDQLERDLVLGKIRPTLDLPTAVAGAKWCSRRHQKAGIKAVDLCPARKNAPDDAILASNTSVIQISIMEGLKLVNVRLGPIGGTRLI